MGLGDSINRRWARQLEASHQCMVKETQLNLSVVTKLGLVLGGMNVFRGGDEGNFMTLLSQRTWRAQNMELCGHKLAMEILPCEAFLHWPFFV